MKKVLIVPSSAQGGQSVSNRLAAELVAGLTGRHPQIEIVRRDVGVDPLPQTLGDALAALPEDDVIREALGDYVCDQFLVVKRAEWSDYRRYVSPWERERYGD